MHKTVCVERVFRTLLHKKKKKKRKAGRIMRKEQRKKQLKRKLAKCVPALLTGQVFCKPYSESISLKREYDPEAGGKASDRKGRSAEKAGRGRTKSRGKRKLEERLNVKI